MKIIRSPFILLLAISFLISCSSNEKKEEVSKDQKKKIEMISSYGRIVLELSNETPQHRDNFIKLVEEKAYDSLLFHRVIEEFMIQGGDPDSKFAAKGDTLGDGDRAYMVPAEINKTLFHKRGVLAAARDGNPERASSAMQFYIVQGKVFNDSLLDAAENRINNWLAKHYAIHDPVNSNWLDSLNSAIDRNDVEAYTEINDTLSVIASMYDDFERYRIPNHHRKVYKEIGGAPHLDQNYTVFGEVLEGMNVVDSIAASAVDQMNRPLNDIRIISMREIKEQ